MQQSIIWLATLGELALNARNDNKDDEEDLLFL